MVAGREIEWSKQAVHLGITLSEDGTMEQDIKVKRARFIEECQAIGRTRLDAYREYLNGRDAEGSEVAIADYLGRGKAIKVLQEVWLDLLS